MYPVLYFMLTTILVEAPRAEYSSKGSTPYRNTRHNLVLK